MTSSPTMSPAPAPLPEGPDPDVLALLMLELGPGAPSRSEADVLLAGPGAVLLPRPGSARSGPLAPGPSAIGPFAGGGSPEALRMLVDDVRALSEDVLVIGPDGGGGDGAEILDGALAPSAAAIGAVDDVDATRALGDALGDVLAAAGVELVLGPVLDVAAGPEPAAATRSFGEDPDLVSRHARAWAGGVRDAGVAVCGLHLPGAGALQEDPVRRASEPLTEGEPRPVPTIGLRRDELEASHLVPWETAPWLDAVLTAPVAVPALGEGIASLSPWSGALLDELAHGSYRGLVIADDLAGSAALAGIGLGGAAARAIRAGACLIAVGGASSLVRAHNAIVEEMDAGRLDEALVRERAKETRSRIRSLRARRRWLPTPDPAPSLATLAHRGAILARRAVQPRRARLDLRPTAVLDVRDGDQGRDAVAALSAALREQGIRADAHGYEHDALRTDQLLLITRRGRASPREMARLQEIGRVRADGILVHTGSPSTAPEAERLVLARGSGAAMMRAVVAALVEARGT